MTLWTNVVRGLIYPTVCHIYVLSDTRNLSLVLTPRFIGEPPVTPLVPHTFRTKLSVYAVWDIWSDVRFAVYSMILPILVFSSCNLLYGWRRDVCAHQRLLLQQQRFISPLSSASQQVRTQRTSRHIFLA